ncbi:MAG: hypothetical protein KAT83_04170, partial [Candidatus Aenigmarchaeota archaeon]|nr:hypothetical protein [Candidatus Aenigmarchaeota archaeon]
LNTPGIGAGRFGRGRHPHRNIRGAKKSESGQGHMFLPLFILFVTFATVLATNSTIGGNITGMVVGAGDASVPKAIEATAAFNVWAETLLELQANESRALANLYLDNSSPIAQAEIIFYLDNTTFATAATDDSGQAELLLNLSAGSHIIKAVFEGRNSGFLYSSKNEFSFEIESGTETPDLNDTMDETNQTANETVNATITNVVYPCMALSIYSPSIVNVSESFDVLYTISSLDAPSNISLHFEFPISFTAAETAKTFYVEANESASGQISVVPTECNNTYTVTATALSIGNASRSASDSIGIFVECNKTNETKLLVEEVKLVQGPAEIGKPVKWYKTVRVENTDDSELLDEEVDAGIPVLSTNIVVKEKAKNKKGGAISASSPAPMKIKANERKWKETKIKP